MCFFLLPTIIKEVRGGGGEVRGFNYRAFFLSWHELNSPIRPQRNVKKKETTATFMAFISLSVLITKMF